MTSPSGWPKNGGWKLLTRFHFTLFLLAILLIHGTAIAQEFFIYEPIAARSDPRDFSALGVPVSKELNIALRDYQSKPGMTTAIGVLKSFPEFYKMTVDQRQKLFDADPDLFLSVDIAKYELVMQTRVAAGAKSSRRVGSTGQRELAIINWRKGVGPKPGLDPAKQFTSDDDVTNLTDSADLLADEKVNGVKAEEAFRKLTREKYKNELNPKDIQTEFLSPTNAWKVFKANYGSGVAPPHKDYFAIPPPPDFLYAWVASNPEKYNDPFGVYMLDVWGYDKGMYTADVKDPLNTTRPFSEVYDKPSSPPASGKFAYIADNYRQIYDVHHGRFESECKYLVRMIDAWEAVHGKAALPPDWAATRAMAEAVYKKGSGVEGAREFQGRIKAIIRNVVVTAHDYQMDRVVAELSPVMETLKGKPDGKLTRADFERHAQLTEELNGLLIAYTNVPEDVHQALMKQFSERIARAEAGNQATEIMKSRVFMHIMEVVQDETDFQKGNVQAFMRIRQSVTDKLGEAVDGADLAQFLETVAKGGAETSRLRLKGLRVVREKAQLTPQEAMQQIEFIHAMAEAFEWSNEAYALKVKEYFATGPDRAVQMLQDISRIFDSTNARPVTVTYTDDSGNTATETVVPSRTRFGLKLFAVAVRGGMQGIEWWGHAANGKDLYLNLHKLFYESGNMSDLEIGQTQAALLANAINFNELVGPWKVPGANVFTANVVGSLSSNAGAVGYDDAVNDELLYAAFKDLAVMYQPQLAGVIALIELGQWGYKEWALSGAKNDIIDAMVENGVWEPADVKQLKQSKPGELPRLKGVRAAEGAPPLETAALARLALTKLILIQSKREITPRETLLDIAQEGGYLDSDYVLKASVDALNEMSGSYWWRKLHSGVLPSSTRNWNNAELRKIGIDIARDEDDRATPLLPAQVSLDETTELALGENQLRLMGYLMADYWMKRQVVLEEGLLPELEKAAARRYLNKLKEAEAEAGHYDFTAQLEEIYTTVRQIDQKLWPRIARSAAPFPVSETYDPEKHTPVLDAFKADPSNKLFVDYLQRIQAFMEDPNQTELRLEGHGQRVLYDRVAAPKEGVRSLEALRARYYKLYDGYEQVHAILDEGKNLANEGKVNVEPFHVSLEPGAWALWALGEGLTPVRGDLATVKKWKDGYAKDERKRVFSNVAEKTKGAPPGSHLEILGQFVLTALGRDTVDTSGSPSHPLWPKLIRLRYQVHTLQLMDGYVDTMATAELADALRPMSVKDDQNVNPGDADLQSASGRKAFLAKTIEQMETEYRRLLDTLTSQFTIVLNVAPAEPYIGQEVVVTAKPAFEPGQAAEALNPGTGFPAYVHKFRWTLQDIEGAPVAPSVETNDPSWKPTAFRSGLYHVSLDALDRGGNPVAKAVFDGPKAQPLLVWGNIGIKSGDHEDQPFAVTAGGWRGEALKSGAFSIELKEFDETMWRGADTRAQAAVVVDGKTYQSNRSEIEVNPPTGLLKLKEDLELALPYNVTITTAATDRAGLPVAGAEATVLVDGADKGKGNSVTARLVTGAAVSASVIYEPLNLTFATPAVIFDPAQGRALTVRAKLPMLDTGHLTVSGRFVPEAAIQPQPQLAGGDVKANIGTAAIGQGAFSLTNDKPLDLSSGSAKFEAQALVTDAAGKRYLPKVEPVTGTIATDKLDLGAIEVARMLMTVKPIQVQLLDWTGKPIPAGAGGTTVSINGVPAANQGGTFSGEHSFSDESERIIIEGAFTLPDGQQSVWQHPLTPGDIGAWQQKPPPPPLLQLKLPFYLPGSLRVSGRTRVDGVPQGRSPPASVSIRDDPHKVDAQAAGNTGFDFVFSVPVQVTENISIQASAEDGEIRYAGAIAAKAPTEGTSLDLGELVLIREGMVDVPGVPISPPVLGAPVPPLPLDDVTVPDLASIEVPAINAALEAAGLHGDFVAAKPESKEQELKFAGQSYPHGSKVPRGTTVTVSIYQQFDDSVTVPDLAAFADAAAMQAALQTAGLKAAFDARKPQSKEQELKFATQSHPHGSKVPRGTTVTVSIYQKFDDQVTVPDLAPLADAAAMQAALQTAGLKADFDARKPPSKEQELKFAGQSYPHGSKVPRGTTVTVSIYQKFDDPIIAPPVVEAPPAPAPVFTPVRAGPEPPCPLPPDRARNAASAFAAMNVVLKHPRCMNCHGVYSDLHDNPNTLHPQPGGHIPQNAMGIAEDQCISCHDRSDASGDGEWRLPPPHMFFTRADVEVCRAVKSTGSGTGTDFLNHLAGDRLILLGFEGKKAQTDKPAEPPPISHEEFLKLGEAWIAAVYGTTSQQEWTRSFPGESGSACGCDASLAQEEPGEPGSTVTAATSDFVGVFVGTIKEHDPDGFLSDSTCELQLTIEQPPLAPEPGELSMRAVHPGPKCLGHAFEAPGIARMEGGVLRWEGTDTWMDKGRVYTLNLMLRGDQLTGEFFSKQTHQDGRKDSEEGEIEATRTE